MESQHRLLIISNKDVRSERGHRIVTAGLLAIWRVAVEKVRSSENWLKMGDRKCIGDQRKSFIGHPGATIFQRDPRERVFQQLRDLSPVIQIAKRQSRRLLSLAATQRS